MTAIGKYALTIALALTVVGAWADVRLPRIFSSHMVLQRRKPVPVWGWAEAGEKVTVQLSNAGQPRQTKTIKADKDGKWLIKLDPTEAGGPYQVLVAGKKNTLTLDDVLFGEVWICSGQSNMEMLVNRSVKPEEKKTAVFPQIRHFKVPHDRSLTPKDDVTGGEWQSTTPETVGNFSAVAYFFARELYDRLQVPIGLVNTCWGGTQVESWISREAMNSFDEFKEPLAQMPVSLEELSRSRKKQMDEAIIQQQGNFPDAQTAQSWSGAWVDDANWKTMAVPGYFDLVKPMAGLDGAVWFRKEITLPAEMANQPMVLSLCSIDDVDRTYVNGAKIGESTQKVPEGRSYIIPANVLKAGKNTIAIRIEDFGSIGGFSGKAEQLKIAKDAYEQSLAGDWKYRVESSVDNNQFAGANVAGTILYNAMIAPLIPYAMQGTIWYQGESNAGRAYQYQKSFPLLISDWRSRWGENFPFLFVQLASYGANGGNSEKGSTWAELREAQTKTLTTVANTGMAVTSDIGETADIHPKNKQDVGKRLAYNALKLVYQQNLVYSGPMYKSHQVDGQKVMLTFDHTGGGLSSSDKYGYVKGFEIAGPDQKFYWAKAEIQGDKVVVWSDQVRNPVAVRYGWSDDNIEANLYNKEGLPASSFRTDTWKGITEAVRFK